MKSSLGVLLVTTLVLAGCGGSQSKPAPATNEVGQNPLNAPTEYLGAAAQAKKTAEKTVDLVSLRRAIEMFQLSEGKLPARLDDLVREGYMPRLPAPPYGTRLDYNPTNGDVRIVAE